MEKESKSFLEQISIHIVDKRNAFFLFYVFAIIFCFFSTSWVQINDDITSYLSDETETKKGLIIANDQFITYGTGNVMVSNITYEKGQEIKEAMEAVEGVEMVTYDTSKDHYHNASALFSISFKNEAKNQITITAMEEIIDIVKGYDYYISSEVGQDFTATLAQEISVVLVIAIIIILFVLLLTSKTYMEIPVLVATFGVAAILNMGTHFLFDEISFVSNSIAVILQLALAIDYAIIMCHRFTEEREHYEAREAAIYALSKAIPEISSSSLTTISGLLALMFMQFQLGKDMGMVLIKALLFSIFVVFTLMPGLLVVVSKWMDKTVHKNFVPKIDVWGKIVVATRKVVPPIFLVLVGFGIYFSNQTSYVFGYSQLTTIKKNAVQLDKEKINRNFKSSNVMAFVVPEGDYEKEGALIKELEALPVVDSVLGLSNIEALGGYVLTDKLTPREFSELTDLDIELAKALYSAYAMNDENYSKLVSGIDAYSISLIDIIIFTYEQKEEGYLNFEKEVTDALDKIYEKVMFAKRQMGGEEYARIIITTNLEEEGEETFVWLDKFHKILDTFYEEGYIVGASTSDYDLATAFVVDNVIIGVLSALFVMIILLFTFKSSGIPVLLVLIIQGSIWINFSFPAIQETKIFFLSYLVVTSIQMGATIDYAIIITSRYLELKKEMPISDAMIMSLNQAFPTILTSGTILASAGSLIGVLSSDPTVSSIGISLGRGTVISLILVMGVLPQTLLLADQIIEKTAFVLRGSLPNVRKKGEVKLSGKVHGYINGEIHAKVDGVLIGEIDARIVNKETEE